MTGAEKVLVTGAGGFTGAALTKRLVANGARPRVMVRSKKRWESLGIEGAEVLEGSVTDRDAVGRAVQGIDVVFHLASVYRQAGLTASAYREVHVAGTRNLCEAARSVGVRRLVHCSSIGVHGHVEKPPADETYRFSAGDVYQRTKLQGEQEARAFHDAANLPVTVIRPTAIYGPGDDRLLKVFHLANRDRPILLGDGEVYYHMVHVEDLVDGFLLAAAEEKAVGEVFIIGGEDYLTLNQLVAKIAALLGRKGKIVHMPVRPFQVLGTVCEKTLIPLGITPPIYRRRIDFFTKSRAFSIDKARRILGFDPKIPLHEGLAETVGAYRERGWIK